MSSSRIPGTCMFTDFLRILVISPKMFRHVSRRAACVSRPSPPDSGRPETAFLTRKYSDFLPFIVQGLQLLLVGMFALFWTHPSLNL